MNILYTNKFIRMFKKLPISIQKKAIQKEAVFKKYPFAKILKTHKLNGQFYGYYSFSVDYQYRIIFKFINKEKAAFMIIGDHSIY